MSNEFPEPFVRLDTFASSVWHRTRMGRYRIEGTECNACGEKFFPPRTGLICPACHERDMKPYECAHTGMIVTLAPDDMGFPAIGYGDYLPRQQAIIRLDDGVHVMSDIMEIENVNDVKVGDRVRMVLRKHKREDTGAWVYGFRFIRDD